MLEKGKLPGSDTLTVHSASKGSVLIFTHFCNDLWDPCTDLGEASEVSFLAEVYPDSKGVCRERGRTEQHTEQTWNFRFQISDVLSGFSRGHWGSLELGTPQMPALCPSRSWQCHIKLRWHNVPMCHCHPAAGTRPGQLCNLFQQANSQGEASLGHSPKQAAGNRKFSTSPERLRALQCP